MLINLNGTGQSSVLLDDLDNLLWVRLMKIASTLLAEEPIKKTGLLSMSQPHLRCIELNKSVWKQLKRKKSV